MNSVLRTGTTGPLSSGPAVSSAQTAAGLQTSVQTPVMPAALPGPVDGPPPGGYEAAGFAPAQIFPDFQPDTPQLRHRARLESLFRIPLALLPPERRQELTQMATQLGFSSLESLHHNVRLLSPQARNKLFEEVVKPQPKDLDADKQLSGLFENAFKSSLDELFPPPLKAPVFEAGRHPDGMNAWNTAAYAAVYNGLKTIASQDPQRFATIARSSASDRDGQPGPLIFERCQNPDTWQDQADTFFDLMSQSIMIAKTSEQEGRIRLFDNCFSRDPAQVTRQALTQLTLLSRYDNQSNQPIPEYRGPEAAERGLDKLPGETRTTYSQRLIEQIRGRFVQEYGNRDWHRLQEAVNYVIRLQDLDNPAVVKQAIQEVPGNSQTDDPATLAALSKIGPENIKRVIARMEQVEAVSQLQRFLRENHPGAGALRADGMLGSETFEMVKSFQTSLALNVLKERIEDDGTLPPERKRALTKSLNDQFTRLEQHPTQASEILRTAHTMISQLLNENPSPVALHTSHQLEQDLPRFDKLVDGRFDTETANYLVNSWFEIMDSGQGLDMAEQLIVHEAGHLWEHAVDTEGLRLEENWEQLFGQNGGKDFFATHKQDFRDKLGHDDNSVSDYGATDAHEDFAEASRIFSYDPERLMRRSLMKFLIMNHLNEGRVGPQQVLEMAQKAGYPPEEVLHRLDSFRQHGPLTLILAHRLDQAYQPLRELVTDLLGSSAPEARFAQPSPSEPSPDQAGWTFDRLVNQIQSSSYLPESSLHTLLSDFVSGSNPPGAEVAFNTEVESFLTRINQARSANLQPEPPLKAQQARATVATLALARAGVSQPQEHPAVKNWLTASFRELIAQPDLLAMLAQGSQFSSQQLLSGSLDQLTWIESTRSKLSQNLSEAQINLSELHSGLAGLSVMLPTPGLFGDDGMTGPVRRQLEQALDHPDVQAFFRNADNDLGMAQDQLNLALRELGRLHGQTYAPVSQRELQAFLLLNRHLTLTPERLQTLLSQHTGRL